MVINTTGILIYLEYEGIGCDKIVLLRMLVMKMRKEHRRGRMKDEAISVNDTDVSRRGYKIVISFPLPTEA